MQPVVDQQTFTDALAIIGMTCRFPGASDLETFWHNLRDGVESVTFFSPQALENTHTPSNFLAHPHFVPATAVIEQGDCFDAAFFGYSAREALLLDPQHRLFLEGAWSALEHAGYCPDEMDLPVGVFGGAGMNHHLLSLYTSGLLDQADSLELRIGNDKDFLSTRVAYKLDLRGPAVNVNTACSTSLVAVHLACQSLLSHECDVALAGGSTAGQARGYLYHEGSIFSSNGQCRPFDVHAQGTVPGEGMGIVVLKRWEDALADGDTIYAIVRGTAINNDGATKVGFTAPSAEAQAEVIAMAQAVAGVSADTISYIEAHGTATALGDPIEVAALQRVFRRGPSQASSCTLGSVKSNIGHLDAAAGVAGLIKTVLALRYRHLPASLHYTAPNPELGLEATSFRVNAHLQAWEVPSQQPRRAGISSFGVGGTNAHVVVEEAPRHVPVPSARPSQLISLSARTPEALNQATDQLAHFFQASLEGASPEVAPPEITTPDAAYTLHVGRKAFEHRRVVVCPNSAHAHEALRDRSQWLTGYVGHGMTGGRKVAGFMFPGGGAQYPNMGRGLYQQEPAYRKALDRCFEVLAEAEQCELQSVLFPEPKDKHYAEKQLLRPSWALPALFATEYALAQLWKHWGVHPAALIGHSLGEYVAATLAEVLTLEEALSLVLVRGQLFEEIKPGAMLSVPLSEAAVQPWLGEEVFIAAINAPNLCVISGMVDALDAFQEHLQQAGVLPPGTSLRRLQIDVAAHSPMVEPILSTFAKRTAALKPKAPTLPYLSNVTGTWVTPEQVKDPSYWVQHLRQPVRFAASVQQLMADIDGVLLEVGPGHTLSVLARMQGMDSVEAVSSLSHPQEHQQTSDTTSVQQALGRLWLHGVEIDWEAYYGHEQRHRVGIPTYPFARQSFAVPQTTIPYGEALLNLQPGSDEASTAFPAKHQRPALLNEYTAPSGQIEEGVAEIWQHLLGYTGIGVHDNFFDLGGNSLLATRILSRLNERFPVELSIQQVLEVSTIAGLAALIEDLLIQKLDSLTEEEVQHLL